MKRATTLALLAIASAVAAGCTGSNSPSQREAHSRQRTSQQRTPHNRLIVLGHSIGGIRLDEPRRSVEKALGPGRSRRRGVVWYFGGRLRVDYWFHDGLTRRVEGLENQVGWLPHSVRCACRVKPRGVARSPRGLPRRKVLARGGAHARCTGDCLHDAARQGRSDRCLLQLTQPDGLAGRGSGDIRERWRNRQNRFATRRSSLRRRHSRPVPELGMRALPLHGQKRSRLS